MTMETGWASLKSAHETVRKGWLETLAGADVQN